MWRTLILGIVVLVLAGCGAGGRALVLADDSSLPAFLDTATPRVRDAYGFAAANPGALEHIPCYCGCGSMGHTSNLSCYAQPNAARGETIFDEHAAGCGICVDITQDVMRMTAAGKPDWEIREYVDAQYSPFGPSTDTPRPQTP